MTVLNQFSSNNTDYISSKSDFFTGVMKTYRQKMKVPYNQNPGISKGPNEEKIKAVLDKTGYTLDVTTGQRKYGGPPPGWQGPPPISGCEVFVGKIPKDIFEDELIPLFEKCGPLWDLRLMMDPVTGQNRGYAFITYQNKTGAQNAVRQLDNYEIRKGKFIGVTVSLNNHRLFVGNIPKNRGKDEIFEEFSKHAPGLTEVIIYSSPDDKRKNRGFSFLEYESHKAASLAKRRLSTGRIKVWGCDIIVDWADPQEEPDEETMSKVKVLYARNLTADVTEEKLKEIFEVFGKVDRVKKIKDYAFIHFDAREQAIKAMTALNGKEIGGAAMQVSLAKPPSDKKKKEEILRNRERRMMQTMQQRAIMMGVPPPPPPATRGRGTRLPGSMSRNYDYDHDIYSYGDYQGGYADPYFDDFYGHYEDNYEYGYGTTSRPRDAIGQTHTGPERDHIGRGIPRGRASGLPVPHGHTPVPTPIARVRGTRGGTHGLTGPIPVPLPGTIPRGSLINKRKFDTSHQNQGDSKFRFQNSGTGSWGSHPIPQQPLSSSGYNGYRNRTIGSATHWYQDSYGQQWG